MLRTIIIEDEPQAARLLESMLRDAARPAEILDICRDLPSGVDAIRKHKPDLVFLDIELPMHRGIDILDFLKPEEIGFQIVFTTAYQDYALKAFEMSATDYLLKPIDETKLGLAVEKAFRMKDIRLSERLQALEANLRKNDMQRLVLPVTNGYEVVQLDRILFMRADGSYTEIHTTDTKPLVISKNLKYFEQVLAGNPTFLRTHRSYMVNIRYVKRVTRTDGGQVEMSNHAALPVSEKRIQVITDALRRL
jgi:two-component system LytT family response regulator